MSSPELHEQSDFNSSLDALERIASIRKEIIKCTVLEDYNSMCRWLKTLWSEIRAMLNNKDRDLYTELYNKFKDNYKEVKNVHLKNNKLINTKIIEDIEEYYLKLCDLIQSYDMNIRKKSDARFALARGR